MITLKEFLDLGKSFKLDYVRNTFSIMTAHYFKIDNSYAYSYFDYASGRKECEGVKIDDLRYHPYGIYFSSNPEGRHIKIETRGELESNMSACMKRCKELRKEYKKKLINEL